MADEAISIERQEFGSIRKAVSTAVNILPYEICGLISSYSARGPHTFNGRFDIQFPNCRVSMDIQTAVAVDVADEYRITTVDYSWPGWHTFVSEQTLAATDGSCSWSVEWQENKKESTEIGKVGWIGVGITFCMQNKYLNELSYSGMADATDWILSNGNTTSDMFVRHVANDVANRTEIPNSDESINQINKIWFLADPRSGTVSARWRRPASKSAVVDAKWFVPQTDGEKQPAFDHLRPCVVLSGRITAVVRSAPTDWPADFREVTILTAAT
jgi:hypothetical protein